MQRWDLDPVRCHYETNAKFEDCLVPDKPVTYRHLLFFHVSGTEDFIELWFLPQNCMCASLNQPKSIANCTPRVLEGDGVIRPTHVLSKL
jgi:hypothetical protein